MGLPSAWTIALETRKESTPAGSVVLRFPVPPPKLLSSKPLSAFRRAINSGLGYRNFNEYLNFYRMRAAKKFLENGENRAYPLIHLALDLGYAAPAPFNRAFKDATGIAPGEYRRRALGL